MPLLLRGRAVTEGALLYSRDEEGRVDFEVAARNEYFDFLPGYRACQTASLSCIDVAQHVIASDRFRGRILALLK